MAYTTHGFISGYKLSGADLVEMDEQILDNSKNIDRLQKETGGIPGMIAKCIRKMSLEIDGDRVFLMYGNEQLSALEIPSLDNVIRCSELTVSGNLVGILAGETRQISSGIQPNNCNQSVRYRSRDPLIATVSSTGVVTGVSRGTTEILVSCGEYLETLPVTVGEVVDLQNSMLYPVDWLNAGTWGTGDSEKNIIKYNTASGSNNLIANIPYNFDKFKIEPGFSINIITTEPLRVRVAIVFKKDSTDYDLDVTDYRDTSMNCYLIDRAVQVNKQEGTTYTTYSYSNNSNEDMYVAFVLSGGNASSLSNINNLCSFTILPII